MRNLLHVFDITPGLHVCLVCRWLVQIGQPFRTEHLQIPLEVLKINWGNPRPAASCNLVHVIRPATDPWRPGLFPGHWDEAKGSLVYLGLW